ncbi:UNVERIFIED_CONTAM: hypothetical protein ABID98_004612 [Brevibacillus sp. OAP136]
MSANNEGTHNGFGYNGRILREFAKESLTYAVDRGKFTIYCDEFVNKEIEKRNLSDFLELGIVCVLKNLIEGRIPTCSEAGEPIFWGE